ncbi:cation:proton antiporter [Novosphingobium malaysiense]|uniref:cation:proton antiporter n=1 Tax=Novosphingobium malaysiense TaxID=1348853 RepID=UPI00068A534A|nr:cation:proton antiporter [Novosphingobium malaysiense]
MEVFLLGFGILVLLVAWLPLALQRLPMSLPVLCLGAGIAAGALGIAPLTYDDLFTSTLFTDFAEISLIVALLGAGLRIDRPVGLRRWNSAWRLIGIGMPIMAVFTVGAAHYIDALALPVAVFLAGVLTPTDPVLASAVSVGPPGSGGEGEVRFGLASEAGLNDGLAFPFVMLGLALIAGESVGPAWLAIHFGFDVVLSVAVGWTVGRGIGWIAFRVKHYPLSSAASGLVALGVALTAFAITELVGGFGFIAVFITALALRETAPSSPFHRSMSDFTDQIERIVAMVLLIVLGATVTNGLIQTISLSDALLAATLLLIARPASVMLSMIGSPLPARGRLIVAFFGIRGIATLYYLGMASGALLPDYKEAHAFAALMVLISVVVHGLAAHPVMAWLDRRRQKILEEGRYPELQALAGTPFGAEEKQE